MPEPFRIRFVNTFYAFELYDTARGDHIYDLAIAVDEAERQYPGEWREVYNGEEGDRNPALDED